MLINKKFAAELYRTANPYKAFAAVNPYADEEDVRRAANNLIDNPNTEADIIELLVQETQQIEAQMAADDDTTLMTLAEQRAILARIARGKQKIKKHVRIRNIVVPVYEDPSATQMILAVRLDRQLAKDQQKLKAAMAAELYPESFSPPQKPSANQQAAPTPPQCTATPPAAPQPAQPSAPVAEPVAATPAPQPQAAAIPSFIITQPATPADMHAPTYTPPPTNFTNPDPGYEPILQKIARLKREEENLSIEERLERDYRENEAYKERKARERREKKQK